VKISNISENNIILCWSCQGVIRVLCNNFFWNLFLFLGEDNLTPRAHVAFSYLFFCNNTEMLHFLTFLFCNNTDAGAAAVRACEFLDLPLVGHKLHNGFGCTPRECMWAPLSVTAWFKLTREEKTFMARMIENGPKISKERWRREGGWFRDVTYPMIKVMKMQLCSSINTPPPHMTTNPHIATTIFPCGHGSNNPHLAKSLLLERERERETHTP
jgi:hypothetical protein